MLATSGEPTLRKREFLLSLGYEPHPGQVLVHRSHAPRRVLVTGVRWGKSLVAVHETLAALFQPRKRALGWIVAPTFELSEIVFGQVVQMTHHHFPHRVVEYSRSERRLTVRNLSGGRSTVRAKSADDPTGLLGEGLDFVVVDEAARLHPEVWHLYLSQRLLDRRGWALLISTPLGRNWLHDLWQRGQGADATVESWSRPSTENPILPRDSIEAERQRLPAWAFAQEYGGEFVGQGGPLPGMTR